MKPRQIIYKSWHIVDAHRRLLFYAFLSTVISAIVGMVYLFFQLEKMLIVFGQDTIYFAEYTKVVMDFFGFMISSPQVFTVFIVLVVLIIIAYMTVPVLAEGAIISLVSKITKEENFRYRDGMVTGFSAYWRLAEYNILTAEFSPFILLFLAVSIIAITGSNLLTLWPVFLVFVVIVSVLSLLFTFAEFFIVLEEQSPIEGIVSSAKLVVLNLDQIFVVLFLIFWVFVRAMFNIALFLIFPLTLGWGFYWLLHYFSVMPAVIILSLLGVVGFVIMIYLFAFLFLLKTVVWQLMFNNLRVNNI